MKRPGTLNYPKNVGPWDLEPHYSRHVSAMTSEGLHDKHDIAFQLALRDKEIELLRKELLAAPRKQEPQGAPCTCYDEALECWRLDPDCPSHGKGAPYDRHNRIDEPCMCHPAKGHDPECPRALAR